MAKLLIGCYSYDSYEEYGTAPNAVITRLRTAVQELEAKRSSYAAQLETDNAFQAIFVAPEYLFTRANATKSREPMSKQLSEDVVRDLKAISEAFPRILMFPGSIFYRESLAVDVNYQKMQAHLIAAELNMAGRGATEVISQPRKAGGVTIPSLKEGSEALKGGLKPDSYRAYNSVRAFLGGESVMTPYNKQWDFKETEGADVQKLVFVPGSAKGTREIREFTFGIEVCFDHGNGALKGHNPNVDIHVVVSDWVENKEGNMAMKNGGYFVHASSESVQTCVYSRNNMGGLQKLNRTAGQLKAFEMAYWLVDIDRRRLDQVERIVPAGAPVLVNNKAIIGKKVM